MRGINLKTGAFVALLAFLATFFASRLRVLSLSYFNAPMRMPQHANFTSFQIKFTDQIRSCEDVVLVEEQKIAILACDPGRETWNTVMGVFDDNAKPAPNAELYAYKYGDLSLSDSQSLVRIKLVGFDSELRTLGLDFHEPSSTLFVTNHARHGSHIEQFHLDLETLTAAHMRSLSHPLIRVPNSIIALSESEFFFTNQHYFTARESSSLLWAFETYSALPIASIVHARISGDDGTLDAAVVTHQAYPNGIALLNKTILAVASSNKRLVYLYAISPGNAQSHPSLSLRSSIWLPFLPDNLAVSKSDGALLTAGHPHLPSLNKFAHSRHVCNNPNLFTEEGKDERQMCANMSAASWASEWTPDRGLEHIYAGWEYPSSASVVRDREASLGFVTGLYARGVMIWRD
ncbi:hypothetical protein HD806DRAFT_507050 [Xylariaceae sp. AK1471]|nr:hypothetical protein HD806DRAFT_507050 [Xylariaceae sp. AK1471]